MFKKNFLKLVGSLLLIIFFINPAAIWSQKPDLGKNGGKLSHQLRKYQEAQLNRNTRDLSAVGNANLVFSAIKPNQYALLGLTILLALSPVVSAQHNACENAKLSQDLNRCRLLSSEVVARCMTDSLKARAEACKSLAAQKQYPDGVFEGCMGSVTPLCDYMAQTAVKGCMAEVNPFGS